MDFRHIKEQSYLFTKEAYELYQKHRHIESRCFWVTFENENFINAKEVIFRFMIEKTLDLFHAKYDFHVYDPDTILKDQQADMKMIFTKPSSIIWKGRKYNVPYDLEYAEAVFSSYELAHERSKPFGRSWWGMYTQVISEIQHQLNVTAQ